MSRSLRHRPMLMVRLCTRCGEGQIRSAGALRADEHRAALALSRGGVGGINGSHPQQSAGRESSRNVCVLRVTGLSAPLTLAATAMAAAAAAAAFTVSIHQQPAWREARAGTYCASMRSLSWMRLNSSRVSLSFFASLAVPLGAYSFGPWRPRRGMMAAPG